MDNPRCQPMRYLIYATAAAIAGAAALTADPAQAARSNVAEHTARMLLEASSPRMSNRAPATGELEVAFSPGKAALDLVLRVIESARGQVCVLAYSFTSAPVVRALLAARKRGVAVQIVVDEANNTGDDRSGRARAALSALVNAGADVRVIDVYAIHHDKVLIVDGRTVQTGSFNYSDAAARRNSENVLVNWDNPALAKAYLTHFERNQRQARPYRLSY